MICPNCKTDQSVCINTRQRSRTLRYRRYRCMVCDARYSTEERVIAGSVMIRNEYGEYVKMREEA